MTLSRARRLSSERTTCQGAQEVSVATDLIERRAGHQWNRNPQHPRINECASRADHDIDPGQRGLPRGISRQRRHGLFQTYRIDSNGLLFDVNTTTAVWGTYPLFAVRSNAPGDGYSTALTGKLDGIEYYNIQGGATVPAAIPRAFHVGAAATRLCQPWLCWVSPGQDEPRKVRCLAPSTGCAAVGRGFAKPVEHFGLLTYGPRA